jgi:threonyl-tRNA synthetase
MERFIGIMLEHYAGALPVWLSPVQAKIIPISDKSIDYASAVRNACVAAGIRVELDDRSEKMGYKIREAETKKIPYMAIVGEKEASSNTVSLRRHKDGDVGSRSLESFVEALASEARKPS